MVDMLRGRGITAVFTSLRTDGAFDVAGDLGLSSLMDTWIKLLDVEATASARGPSTSSSRAA